MLNPFSRIDPWHLPEHEISALGGSAPTGPRPQASSRPQQGNSAPTLSNPFGGASGGREYNPLMDPGNRTIFGTLGGLMGFPTAAQHQKNIERQEEMQRRRSFSGAFEQIQTRVASGMAPQKAVLDWIQTPEGMEYFSTHEDPVSEMGDIMKLLAPDQDEQDAEIRKRIFGTDDPAEMAVANEGSRLTDPTPMHQQPMRTTPREAQQESQRDMLLKQADILSQEGLIEDARVRIALADAVDADEDLVEIYDPTSPTGRRLVPKSQAVGQPKPAPGSLVTIDQTGETEQAKILGRAIGEEAANIIERGRTANQRIAQIQAFRAAQESGRFVPGTLGGFRSMLSGMAEFIGIPTEEGILRDLGLGSAETAQTMESMAALMGVELANSMEGLRSTNMALDLLRTAVPNLVKTPGGNKIILDLFETQALREQELRNLTVDYITKHGTTNPPDQPTLWDEINRLHVGWREADADFMERIKTENENARGIGFDDMLRRARGEEDPDAIVRTGEELEINAESQQDARSQIGELIRQGRIRNGDIVIINGKPQRIQVAE